VAPGRGKFRSFLLTSLNHFLADEHARQQTQKRGGGRQIVSFDAQAAEQRYQLEPLSTETPEKLFEQRWATTLLDGALRRLQQDYEAAGNGALFEHLRGFVVEGAEGRPYAQVAQQLRMTEEAVKKAVQRLRRRYRAVIREEIAHTVSTADEIDEELRHLWSVLCG
jgi:RNA polymerase sigma-70 factor (ECF subfamily)